MLKGFERFYLYLLALASHRVYSVSTQRERFEDCSRCGWAGAAPAAGSGQVGAAGSARGSGSCLEHSAVLGHGRGSPCHGCERCNKVLSVGSAAHEQTVAVGFPSCFHDVVRSSCHRQSESDRGISLCCPVCPTQGLLSFLSAPLIGALSDVWGRKSFLLLTVFFTCAPIPLMKISPW